MKMGIDWFSTAVLLGAYVFSRIPGVNARLGNGAMAAACGLIALVRFRAGAVGFNLAMVALAAGFCVFYLIRAVRAGVSRRPSGDD